MQLVKPQRQQIGRQKHGNIAVAEGAQCAGFQDRESGLRCPRGQEQAKKDPAAHVRLHVFFSFRGLSTRIGGYTHSHLFPLLFFV